MGIRRPDQMAMSHEHSVAASEENYHPLTQIEEDVFFKFVLPREKGRPTIQDEDFFSTYSRAEVAKDQSWLDRITANDINEPKTQRSRTLETAMMHYAESADWISLNPETGESYAIPTTEYDDDVNHIDFVMEWQYKGQVYRLGIDATTSESGETLTKKENKIQEEIKRGKLGTVKYLISQARPEFQGRISKLPRVVLAVNRELLQELCQDLITKKPAELADNPVQFLLLEQIRESMSDQIKYALSLLLDRLEKKLNGFNEKSQKQLIPLLQNIEKLSQEPENLTQVLTILEQHKELFDNLPAAEKYLTIIDKLEEIRLIAQKIIEEKSGLLKQPEVAKEAALQAANNIVLLRTKARASQFRLPAGLRDLAV